MTDPIMIDDLASALDLGRREFVSLVGGGGKTTSLFALGRQLQGTVVLTTTTKMGRERTGGRTVLFSPTDSELTRALDRDRCVLAWREDAVYKALGVDPDLADRWFDIADHLVVEADGSRRRPFKAPRPFEPVIPSRSTVVVACVGSRALARVIADECQRPGRVAAAARCLPYERLTPERLAMVLLSDRGSRKHCPPGARFAVMINRVGSAERAFVDELAGIIASIDSAVPVIPVAPFEPEHSPEPPSAAS